MSLRRASIRALRICFAVAPFFLSDAAVSQTSVSLYGRVIGGIDYVNKIALSNGRTGDMLRYNGSWGASWWGLRVQEDLGGGMQAVANLESMFASGDGTTGSDNAFNRYAVVGLASQRWGTLWLGRAMALTDSELWAVDPLGMQFTGVATLAYGRNWGPRSNAVTYNSPDWGGLSFRLQAGLGGVPGKPSAGRQLSTSISYSSGPVLLKGVYEEIRDAQGDFSNLYATSREYALGAAYEIGRLKLFAGYGLLRSDGATVADADNPTASDKHQQYWLGANYAATPALTLLAGIYRAQLNRGGGSATLVGIGANYALSKRTLLYATVGNVANRGIAAYSVEVTTNTKPLPGAAQQGLYAGVAHSF